MGIRVANLMSFSCTCLRRDLYSFSSCVSSFFSFCVRSSFSIFAFLTDSDLLMMVSRMLLPRLRKPSIRMIASIAALLAMILLRVSLSTLTNNALSQRLANMVALVPRRAMSSTSPASMERMTPSSYASTGRKFMNWPTAFSRLGSLTFRRVP
ncbi:hypothetical protein SDC9_153951 [bioreactor metagenome]|uniref:Uncharacterized protein n=1 Tax=bioreactor metagenome TaxID=1076179 RepID=A0A645EXB9_9ZZZZ